jgi:hypothetical protein
MGSRAVGCRGMSQMFCSVHGLEPNGIPPTPYCYYPQASVAEVTEMELRRVIASKILAQRCDERVQRGVCLHANCTTREEDARIALGRNP